MTVKRSRRATTLRQKMMKKMNLHKMNTLQRQRPAKMSQVRTLITYRGGGGRD